MKTLNQILSALVCAVSIFASVSARAVEPDRNWNVAILDQILSAVPPGQNLATVGDMQFPVTELQSWRNYLATGVNPLFAIGTNVTLWPGGTIPYIFSNGISSMKQQAFVDAAEEWTLFASVHFIPRTSQTDYVMVYENPNLGGGLSAVGKVGGQQLIQIGPSAWNRRTLSHEIGHTLGLVHEHQRSDRDNFIMVISNNISPGQEFNFVLLPTSQNHGAYDFFSIMHYQHNAFGQSNGLLDTMVPLPAYTNFYNVMGKGDPVLSVSDRTNMAAVYGAATVPVTNVVTNTLDNGPGSLRAALYYAFDHKGTTITFNILTNDPGFGSGVFTIQPDDQLPGLINATTVDATTEPAQFNPPGPAIQLNGTIPTTLSPGAYGVNFGGSNCLARGLIINGFPEAGVRFSGTNCFSNTVSGCYVGTDGTGSAAVQNGVYPVLLETGAWRNIVGGTGAAARNVISGGKYQGIFITDAGTWGNVIEGNYIGLNAAGSAALPNGYEGVGLYNNVQSNVIGGPAVGAGNVISGNSAQGITLTSGASGNVVQGNYIGLDATGSSAVPNNGAGVLVASGSSGNLIGGTTTGARNVISGNIFQGIQMGGSANTVAGNYIGLNAAGLAAVANGNLGVWLTGGAQSNLIGGTAPGARNFISGNTGIGVAISGAGVSANVVQGNTIGLDARNNAGLPNTGGGMQISSAAVGSLVGGLSIGAANLIASNNSVGVFVTGSTTSNNTVRGNSIYGNSATGQFGIVVQSGGNSGGGVIPAPAVTSAVVGATNTVVIGSLGSPSPAPANTTFHIDFYVSPGSSSAAQARDYLGAKDVTTSAGGSVTFTNSSLGLVPIGQFITLTATDPAGNTSTETTFPPAVSGTDSVGDGIPNVWRSTYFGGTGTTTNSTNCATCDADHDGMNNMQEFLSGTNPTNAASVLKAGTVATNGTNIVLTFQTVPGIVYRVQQRDDVVLGFWAIFADQIVGSGNSIQVTDPGAASLEHRYYRLQVLP